MAWIFQGNPDRYDIDAYLSQYPELIYWKANRYMKEIRVGDRVFLWRSGAHAGAVALGTVVEAPTPVARVQHAEALGTELWNGEDDDPKGLKVGIRTEEIRLDESDGMVTRAAVKTDPVLRTATIITPANATVFKLTESQTLRMLELWPGGPGHSTTVEYRDAQATAIREGDQVLVSHYRRERSRYLRNLKIKQCIADHGHLECELCRLTPGRHYPADLSASIFEVHHRLPLSNASEPVGTRLEDLAVLCANCHRAVHATRDVEKNFQSIRLRLRSNSTSGERDERI